MKTIVAAFDSFKGSLTSREAGEAFRRGVLDVYPDADVRVVAIADGGEGMAEAVCESLGGEWVSVQVHDPIGRLVDARYVVVSASRRAVIAMSAASGITLLNHQERNPLIASTYGTGELILDALNRGCREIVVGLGGSATNDGGAGMLRALGYRFYDADGEELIDSIDILERLHRISDVGRNRLLDNLQLTVAVDVDNPLFGATGAAYVFARQKGADDAMVERLDMALRHYAEVVDLKGAEVAGSGAAGGMGYAFSSVLGAELRSGIDIVLELIGFDAIAEGSILVVTGEGSVDFQTLHGKAPCGVLAASKRLGIQCIVVGGCVSDVAMLQSGGFAAVYEAKPADMSLSEAMYKPTAEANLRAAGRRIALETCEGG